MYLSIDKEKHLKIIFELSDDAKKLVEKGTFIETDKYYIYHKAEGKIDNGLGKLKGEILLIDIYGGRTRYIEKGELEIVKLGINAEGVYYLYDLGDSENPPQKPLQK